MDSLALVLKWSSLLLLTVVAIYATARIISTAFYNSKITFVTKIANGKFKKSIDTNEEM